MGTAFVLLREVAVMSLLIALGVFSKKRGFFTTEAARQIANFLLVFVMPALLINTFQQDKKPEQMPAFWMALLLATILFGIMPVVATFVFRKTDDTSRHLIARLATVMPNCGFMGIPLLLATTGKESLIYCVGIIGIFQLQVWCWAVPMIEGKKVSLKLALFNPGVISFAIGISLFLLEIRLPQVCLSFIGQIAGLNTPLSMIMIGIFLADVKPLEVLTNPLIYKAVFFRNLAFPLLTVTIIYIFGLHDRFGELFALSIVIIMSCSSAASVLLLPARAGKDSPFASELIAASTLFSILTLPFVGFIAEKIF